MITEQYVEFETAKLLKEKGFDVRCRKGYWHDKQLCLQPCSNNADAPVYACPTQSLVMRWLREVHNIHINVVFLGPSLKWTPTIWKIDTKIPESHHIKSTMNTWETYEEATENAIKYCLENLIKMTKEVTLYPGVINPYNYVMVRPRVIKKEIPGSQFGLTYNTVILEPVEVLPKDNTEK